MCKVQSFTSCSSLSGILWITYFTWDIWLLWLSDFVGQRMIIWIQKLGRVVDAPWEKPPVYVRVKPCAHAKATTNPSVAEHSLSVRHLLSWNNCNLSMPLIMNLLELMFILQVAFCRVDVAFGGGNGMLKLGDSDFQMIRENLKLSLKMPCFVYLPMWTTFVTELHPGKNRVWENLNQMQVLSPNTPKILFINSPFVAGPSPSFMHLWRHTFCCYYSQCGLFMQGPHWFSKRQIHSHCSELKVHLEIQVKFSAIISSLSFQCITMSKPHSVQKLVLPSLKKDDVS